MHFQAGKLAQTSTGAWQKFSKVSVPVDFPYTFTTESTFQNVPRRAGLERRALQADSQKEKKNKARKNAVGWYARALTFQRLWF